MLRQCCQAALLGAFLFICWAMILYMKFGPSAKGNDYAPAWDTIVFSQEWRRDLCSNASDPNNWKYCGNENRQTWSVKYIVPIQGYLIPTGCSSDFDVVEQVASINASLDRLWVSYSREANKWDAIWNSYGACFRRADHLGTPIAYFNQGLTWLKKYNIYAILKERGILPGGAYTLADIVGAIKAVLKVDPFVNCYNNEDAKLSYISVVHLCFDPQLHLVSCKRVIKKGGLKKNCDPKGKLLYLTSSITRQDTHEIAIREISESVSELDSGVNAALSAQEVNVVPQIEISGTVSEFDSGVKAVLPTQEVPQVVPQMESRTQEYISTARPMGSKVMVDVGTSAESDWDVVIFSQVWQPSLCVKSGVCQYRKKRYWSINGVWPLTNTADIWNSSGVTGPTYCNMPVPYDESSLELINPPLRKNWLHQKGLETWLTFELEYNKYGSCMVDEFRGPVHYFLQALLWKQRFNLTNVLLPAYNAPEYHHSIREIYQMIQNFTTKKPIVKCVFKTKSRRNVSLPSEVYLCFNKYLDIIDCTVFGSYSTFGGMITNCDVNVPILYGSLMSPFESRSPGATNSPHTYILMITVAISFLILYWLIIMSD